MWIKYSFRPIAHVAMKPNPRDHARYRIGLDAVNAVRHAVPYNKWMFVNDAFLEHMLGDAGKMSRSHTIMIIANLFDMFDTELALDFRHDPELGYVVEHGSRTCQIGRSLEEVKATLAEWSNEISSSLASVRSDIEFAIDTDAFEDMDDYDDEQYRGYFLGSFINPSGKFYTPFANSNADLKDVIVDETFWTGLDAIAESYGGWVMSGEGDPTDTFFCLPND